MQISNYIELVINSLLKGDTGTAEIKRNELALKIGCVPSQINYVIQTRFTRERGYLVESRRGGGGFIRITKVKMSGSEYLMHVINSIGNIVDYPTAMAIITNISGYGIISEREKEIILSALSLSSLPLPDSEKNEIRSAVMKNILIKLI